MRDDGLCEGPCLVQIIFVLVDLGPPYEIKVMAFSAIKSPPFTDINPDFPVPGACRLTIGILAT